MILTSHIVERSRSHKGAEYMRTFEHQGLGEEGKYHSKEDEHPLPEGTQLTYALVGNQNCGKTTLFNQLTGANLHVGNFPGVTVASKILMIAFGLSSSTKFLETISSLL